MADAAQFDGVFQAIDAMDAEAFIGFLTDDAEFSYGSQPAVKGRAAIRDYVAGFFGSLEGIAHHLGAVHLAGDDVAIIEGQVSYRLTSGRTVSLPFANVFRLRGAEIHSYRVYIDPTPLAG